MVRRGAPGTLASQSSAGKFSIRKIVTRLFVFHSFRIVSRKLSGEGISQLSDGHLRSKVRVDRFATLSSFAADFDRVANFPGVRRFRFEFDVLLQFICGLLVIIILRPTPEDG